MNNKHHKNLIIIIIGPQASGKGTQAEFVAQKLGIPHIGIGDVFRKEVASGSELGQLLKSYMDKGELVPKELNNKIVENLLAEHSEGLILDGYPRNQGQAAFLDSHIKVDRLIVLEVPDEECIRRISGRRVCDNGHDYHVQYAPPKQEGICDVDGLPLHTRADDQPDAIAKRLGIYHEQTEPLIEHYTQQGVVVKINGAQSIGAVKQEITGKLS